MSDFADSRRATAVPWRNESEVDDGFAGGHRMCGGLGAFEALSDIVERSIEHAVFGGELGRREFIQRVGATTAAAALASVFPLGAAKAVALDKPGALEKEDLKIGFIPITCATPIIMAEPMGFYKKQGLNVQVTKASSWAMIRDLSAIDCVVKLEKKGERGVLTIDAKFLHYKEY